MTKLVWNPFTNNLDYTGAASIPPGGVIETINNIGPDSSDNYTFESTDGTVTFTPITNGLNLSAAATELSLSAFGSTPNANGLTLTGTVLNMQPADGTHPGGVSTTTQTFGGAKNFAISATSPIFGVLSGGGGTAQIEYPSSATNYNFNLPATAGTSGYFLTSAGGATAPMTWTSISGAGGLTTANADSGSATPTAGAITWAGGSNITTSASGSTVTINVAAGAGLSLGPFGSSPNANGLSLSSGTLTMQPTDGTHPGGVSTTTQTIAGAKTFSTSVSSPEYLVTGSGSGAISILPQASAGTYNFNLPITAGTSGYFLTSAGGAGSPMTWTQNNFLSSISLTGDTGGALTGSSFTFTGSATGLTFAGSGSTLTLGGDLVVSNGGTGNSTFTAYSVICAGTTATGAFQNVSGVGSSGQILTSNGASALPTWQSAAAGGITTVGDVTTGTVAFNGTIGTTLTSTTAGFNILVTAQGANTSTGGAIAVTGGAGGTGTTGGVGGAVTVTGGTAHGSAANAGGQVELLGGAPSATGVGGAAKLVGGAGGATSGSGGAVNVTGGANSGSSGNGGAVVIASGTSTNGTGGAISMTVGAGSFGGNITITAGVASPSSGNTGGNVTVAGGVGDNGGGQSTVIGGAAGSSTSSSGGSAVIQGGAGDTSGAGGSVQLIGGVAGGTGAGGQVTIASGNGGSTSGDGGLISITGGHGVGTDRNSTNMTLQNPRGTGAGQVGKMLFLAGSSGTASGTTLHTAVNRLILNGSVALTTTVASTIATLTLASGSTSGGTITYLVECTDGTDYQSASGVVPFSATNKSGTKSGATSPIAESKSLTTGTLVNIFSVTSGGLVQITSTTSLTPTFYQITYEISCLSAKQTITIPS